jgi:hypothetical protein
VKVTVGTRPGVSSAELERMSLKEVRALRRSVEQEKRIGGDVFFADDEVLDEEPARPGTRIEARTDPNDPKKPTIVTIRPLTDLERITSHTERAAMIAQDEIGADVIFDD